MWVVGLSNGIKGDFGIARVFEGSMDMANTVSNLLVVISGINIIIDDWNPLLHESRTLQQQTVSFLHPFKKLLPLLTGIDIIINQMCGHLDAASTR